MLSRLFQQLFASIGVIFRMIRAFFVRALSSSAARIKNAASLTRQAAKLGPTILKTVFGAGKKPTKREDYIETKQMFISKSFLILVSASVIVLAVLFYTIAWPWLVSKFLTARLWCEDPDTKLHTGKVVLYYEQEKENVYFKGRLEDGVIQGEGTAFDENGLMIYSGNYADGTYSGEGTLYVDGALTYKGDFADGLYHGTGKLYGSEERLIYEGTFADGLYDGEGKLYDLTETLRYEGEFADGLYHGTGKLYNMAGQMIYIGDFFDGARSGEGTAYYNGKKQYRGSFENDQYNGTGILYDDDGTIVYEGTFVDGLYDGAGTLFLEDGVTVEASFRAGELEGTARYLRSGKLFYEGDAVRRMPEGTGTLYGGDGKALYTGPMRSGTIDGGALLGLSAEELRLMLRENLTETVGEQGFAITDEKLGMTTFCSYAQEEIEPAVYYVYLYDGKAVSELLWESVEEFEVRSLAGENAPKPLEGGIMSAVFPAALPVELGERAWCRMYQYEDYTLCLWSKEENSVPLLVEWRLNEHLPTVAPTEVPSAGAAGRLEEFLSQLGVALSQAGTAAGRNTSDNPYYGQQDAEQLLEQVAQEDLSKVVTAALTYFECAERRVVNEENLELYRVLLAEEQEQADLGKGNLARIAQLETMVSRLDVEIMKDVVQMRKASRTVEDAAELDIKRFDLQELSVLFDATQLDAAALGEEAVAIAMEKALAAAEQMKQEETAKDTAGLESESPATSEDTGDETSDVAISEDGVSDVDAAEEPETTTENGMLTEAEPAVEPVDQKMILNTVEDGLLELDLSRQGVLLALREYETALEFVSQAEQAYAMGTLSNRERLESRIAANELRASLYMAAADFSRRAAAFNETTGGMLAKEVGWMPEVLGNC